MRRRVAIRNRMLTRMAITAARRIVGMKKAAALMGTYHHEVCISLAVAGQSPLRIKQYVKEECLAPLFSRHTRDINKYSDFRMAAR